MKKSHIYDFSDRVALVTGAGKETGIGFAIAKRLSQDGATVIISDVCADICEGDYARTPSPRELYTLAQSIGGHGLVMDICSDESVDDSAREIANRFGRLDFLVNNAGAGPAPNLLQYMDLSMWRKTLDINLTGTLMVTRAMLPLMTGKGPAIVNTASGRRKAPPDLRRRLLRHQGGGHHDDQGHGPGNRRYGSPYQRDLSRIRLDRHDRMEVGVEIEISQHDRR